MKELRKTLRQDLKGQLKNLIESLDNENMGNANVQKSVKITECIKQLNLVNKAIKEDEKNQNDMKGLKLWEVLKALDEGKRVECLIDSIWHGYDYLDLASLEFNFDKGFKFRIKPEVEVREYYGYVHNDRVIFTDVNSNGNTVDPYKITIEFEYGEPICESIKMEKI